MINKGYSQSQKCSSCQQYLLESIGSNLFCLGCRKIVCQIEQEVRVVPAKYESNSRSQNQLTKQRRLNKHIEEFTEKYRSIDSPDQMNVFRSRLQAMKQAMPKCKGTRQAAAVVVYQGLKQQIRRTIKQFCNANNLSVKTFNQKYKLYHRLFSKIDEVEEDIEVKMEVKVEQDQTQKSQYAWIQVQIGVQAKRSIQILFDRLFPQYFYQQKKQFIVARLITLLKEIPQSVLVEINYSSSPPIKLFYLIFAVLKSLRYKTTFDSFAEIVMQKGGYRLKRKPAYEIRKVYERSMKRELKQQEQGDFPGGSSGDNDLFD